MGTGNYGKSTSARDNSRRSRAGHRLARAAWRAAAPFESLEKRFYLSFAPSVSAAGPAVVNTPFALDLSYTGSAVPTSWRVLFGDGTPAQTFYPSDFANSNGVMPDPALVTHLYATAGRYSVTATATVGTVNYTTALTLDSTFGPSAADPTHYIPASLPGQVITSTTAGPDAAYATALQADGKIVVAGVDYGNNFGVLRYNPDGTPDTTFGAADPNHPGLRTGLADIGFGTGATDKALAVAIDANGKILAAGLSNSDCALARLNADGSLDSGFGANGLVTTDIVGNNVNTDVATSLLVQRDGKIVLAGYTTGNTLGPGGSCGALFSASRYTMTGAPDPAFGTGVVNGAGGSGKETIAVPNSDHDYCQAVLLQPNNAFPDGSHDSLVLGGYAVTQNNACGPIASNFVLTRLKYSGQVDGTFGSSGFTQTNIGLTTDGCCASPSLDSDYSLLVQADGKIVAAGASQPYSGALNDLALARYSANGFLDGTFGTGGVVTADLGGDDYAYASVLQSDQKIVVAGTTTANISSTGVGNDFCFARFNPNGTLDSTFGSLGKLTTDIAALYDSAQSLVVLPDGRLLAAGSVGTGSPNGSNPGQNFGLVSLRADNTVHVTPTAPTNLAATTVSASQITLNWTDPAFTSQVRVERSADGGATWGTLATLGSTATSYPDGGLLTGKSYQYRVSAIDTAGDASPPATITGWTVAAPPTLAAAVPQSDGSILLNSSGGSADENHFRVLMSTDGGATFPSVTDVGNVTSWPAPAPALTPGVAYTFAVQGANSTAGFPANWSANSNTLSATAAEPAPTSLTATAVSPTEIDLAWAAPSSLGIVVQRSLAGAGVWTTLAVLPPGTTAFADTDPTLLPGTGYDYAVFTRGPAGDSAAATVSAATVAVPPTIGAVAPVASNVGDLVTLSVPFTPGRTSADFSANVDWGDGVVSAADAAADGGFGNILATHAYTAPGSFSAVIRLSLGGNVVATVTTIVTIGDPPVTLAPIAAQNVKEGEAFNFVATFTAPAAYNTYSATINWGDGTTEPATVLGGDGSGSVTASHTYARAGSFTTTVSVGDAAGTAAQATATVVVQQATPEVDAGPFVQRTPAGTAVTLNVGYTDPAADGVMTLSWSVLDAGGQSVATSNSQSFDFTPSAVGTYTATVTATDSEGASKTATTKIVAYDPANPPAVDAPAAPVGLSVSTDSPDGVVLNWQAGGGDADGYEIQWSDDGSGFYRIDEVPAGVTTYTDKNPNYDQSNHYRIVAYNGGAESAPSDSVTAGAYTEPIAFGDQNAGPNEQGTLSPYSVSHDQTLNVPAESGLLADDVNLANDGVQVVSHTDPAHGTLVLDDDGGFTYTPDPGFVGTDSFAYRTTNGYGTSALTPVAIDVTNAVPRAVDSSDGYPDQFDDHGVVDSHAVWQGTTYYTVPGSFNGQLSATDADGDPLTYALVSAPRHGTIQLDPQTGQYLYVPNGTFTGADGFTFTVSDGITTSLPGNQVIWDGNTFWALGPEIQIVAPGGSVKNDVALGAPTWQAIKQPDHGNFSIGKDPSSGATTYTYTPSPGFTGYDTVTLVQPVAPFSYKPWTIIFNVTADANAQGWHNASSSNASTVDVTGVPNAQSSYWPQSLLQLAPLGLQVKPGQDASHGHVSLLPDGSFTYQPKPDPQSGEPYYGWDFFSYLIQLPGGSQAEEWVQLDVGDYAPPTSAIPPGQLPAAFPGTLEGLWQYYNQAKDRLVETLQAVAGLGVANQQLADSDPTNNEAQQVAAVGALDQVNRSYDAYLQAFKSANAAAGAYMASVWVTSDKDFAVEQAIAALPTHVIGIKPTNDQMQQWSQALQSYADGADVQLSHNTTVVNVAHEIHDAAEIALMVGGATSIAVTGAEILTEAGCAKFAEFAAEQVVNTAKAEIYNYAAQQALSLSSFIAQQFGITIDPQYIQIGADALQVVSLLKAARAERQAAGANCFVAGTEVQTANGPVPIQQVQVGQRVLTEVDAGPADGGPPAPSGDPNSTDVDPATWRLVSLDMPDPQQPGDEYAMQLLEPLSWIADNGASVGGWVDLDLPELQIHGVAAVKSVAACPKVEDGAGRVVLGTFQHVSSDLVDVGLSGQDKPLEVTAGHKLWSLDRGGWVVAGDLRAGERLAAEHGAATVTSVAAEAGRQEVYNLDVEADHRYLVAGPGVLAHNTCPTNPGNNPYRRETASIPHTDPKRVLNLGGEGEFPGATDLNTNPGAAIQQDMLQPWSSVPDNSMEGIIGNRMPAFDDAQCAHIASEAYRTLQPGGEMRVWSTNGSPGTMRDAMVAAGFGDVLIKGLTVMGKK